MSESKPFISGTSDLHIEVEERGGWSSLDYSTTLSNILNNLAQNVAVEMEDVQKSHSGISELGLTFSLSASKNGGYSIVQSDEMRSFTVTIKWTPKNAPTDGSYLTSLPPRA